MKEQLKDLFAAANIVAARSLIPWPLAKAASFLIFAVPGTTTSPAITALFFAIWIYPPMAILGNIGFWLRFRKGSTAELALYTAISSVLPLLAICSLVVLQP